MGSGGTFDCSRTRGFWRKRRETPTFLELLVDLHPTLVVFVNLNARRIAQRSSYCPTLVVLPNARRITQRSSYHPTLVVLPNARRISQRSSYYPTLVVFPNARRVTQRSYSRRGYVNLPRVPVKIGHHSWRVADCHFVPQR